MMTFIDSILGRVTMYRFLVYYLLGLLATAMAWSAVGGLAFSPMAIMAATAYLVLGCWLANKGFARLYHVPANPESPLITALILALIITPPTTASGYIFLTMVSILAMASKYLLTIRRQHIFNPAAVAVALMALGAGQSASWWVGTTVLAPFVLMGGVLLVRKIERGQMVTVFIATTLLATAAMSWASGGDVPAAVMATVLHSSLLFMAFVMLTEPLTSPATLVHQRWYGVLAGALFPPQLHIGVLYSTPELVLMASNVFSYVVSPKAKLLPILKRRVAWGASTTDFIFAPEQPVHYRAGQYMEWTLPHKQPDSRGSRRYFTLASSPTESELRVGVRFYEAGSSFKQALASLTDTTPLAAGHVGGDFTLPAEASRKLAFIAGGIGVTPFRSMIKYLYDTNDRRPVTLLYSERTAADLAYGDVFNAAHAKLGTKLVYTLSDQETEIPAGMHAGMVSAELIRAEVPDYAERLFYISGPHTMVVAIRGVLRDLGVKEAQIKVDFFPGYA